MGSYFCIVDMPGVPVSEIAAVGAVDDATAAGETRRIAALWPGFETIALYEGERVVCVLANPRQGFAPEPSGFSRRAA